MKIGNPYEKSSLHIKKGGMVLEIGPGSNPTREADVLVEKFIDDNHHRRGDFRIYPHQTILQADATELPFSEKLFDYVICSHVIEHVDDPAKFAAEQSRVAKAGYLEAPSLIGEILAPKESHKSVSMEIDNKFVMFEKSKMPYDFKTDFGDLFLNYLPYHSLPFRLQILTRNNFNAVRYEWKDSIDIVVNPSDEHLSSFFLKKWDSSMVREMFPELSTSREFIATAKAMCYFIKQKAIRALGIYKKPVSFEEYTKQHSSSNIS